MSYGVILSEGAIGINTKRFKLGNEEQLKKTYEKLQSIYSNEKLYDQVVESYIDLKSSLHDMVVRSAIQGRFLSFRNERREQYETNSKLNRILFNFLNLSKFYIDEFYSPKACFAYSITEEEENQKDTEEFKKKERNQNTDFELGIQLRNSSQHGELPIKYASKGMNITSSSKTVNVSFSIPIQKEAILNSLENGERKCSQRIKKQISESYQDKIDLHMVLDSFIFSISNLHNHARMLTEAHLQSFKEYFNNLNNKINQAYPNLTSAAKQYTKNDVPLFFQNDVERVLELIEYLNYKNSSKIEFSRLNLSTYVNTDLHH